MTAADLLSLAPAMGRVHASYIAAVPVTPGCNGSITYVWETLATRVSFIWVKIVCQAAFRCWSNMSQCLQATFLLVAHPSIVHLVPSQLQACVVAFSGFSPSLTAQIALL